MHLFAIVTDRADRFAELNYAIEQATREAAVSWHESGAAALISAKTAAPDLMVVDEDMADISAPTFLRRLMAVDANINTAVASNRTHEDFHETYEGLGVLMHLPPRPDRAATEKLIARLDALGV